MIKISFQGEHGAYSEQAITSFLNSNSITDSQTVPCLSFYNAIEATIKKQTDFVIIPVENSLAGSVVPAYDELIKSNLKVKAEIILKIQHCLMGLPNADLSKIESVISHPQALSQCSNSLKKLKLEPEAFADTAGAAKYIFEKKSKNHLAIAGKLAAETYDLEIIQSEFEDEHFNYTRFLVMGREDIIDVKKDNKKTTIIFSVEDKANALVEILSIFGEYDINLTKIESRPSRDRAWDYLFFIDFEGSEDDDKIQLALLKILKKSTFLRVLGSYETYQYE
ncbi:prephenate dehydratase [Francisella adeliensis]|uniref:Prephenate dehydratase n=1 Tax=Francisella adeliensis TaxID=2007306 RepID=A0A2Z4XZ06_9GAMM|nr:prephenate dehydratase [Francisella adeliensis]AXA34091.1 prephenate dehydratase [Francisella adeliensis]MBK2085258.1 prephenate dehydratase [Francisella adeliensis]MBK2095974.1 prephenate dehydratase [Francisella adeliensis]QIW12332.1 prephenate dehydratase [Francisella adeliensis]QIW14206.1 prephenate dehydratase [Francisella adeliensis]